jgi:hypothetical protein
MWLTSLAMPYSIWAAATFSDRVMRGNDSILWQHCQESRWTTSDLNLPSRDGCAPTSWLPRTSVKNKSSLLGPSAKEVSRPVRTTRGGGPMPVPRNRTQLNAGEATYHTSHAGPACARIKASHASPEGIQRRYLALVSQLSFQATSQPA